MSKLLNCTSTFYLRIYSLFRDIITHLPEERILGSFARLCLRASLCLNFYGMHDVTVISVIDQMLKIHTRLSGATYIFIAVTNLVHSDLVVRGLGFGTLVYPS